MVGPSLGLWPPVLWMEEGSRIFAQHVVANTCVFLPWTLQSYVCRCEKLRDSTCLRVIYLYIYNMYIYMCVCTHIHTIERTSRSCARSLQRKCFLFDRIQCGFQIPTHAKQPDPKLAPRNQAESTLHDSSQQQPMLIGLQLRKEGGFPEPLELAPQNLRAGSPMQVARAGEKDTLAVYQPCAGISDLGRRAQAGPEMTTRAS